MFCKIPNQPDEVSMTKRSMDGQLARFEGERLKEGIRISETAPPLFSFWC
jgi:hypothetical protein